MVEMKGWVPYIVIFVVVVVAIATAPMIIKKVNALKSKAG